MLCRAVDISVRSGAKLTLICLSQATLLGTWDCASSLGQSFFWGKLILVASNLIRAFSSDNNLGGCDATPATPPKIPADGVISLSTLQEVQSVSIGVVASKEWWVIQGEAILSTQEAVE